MNILFLMLLLLMTGLCVLSAMLLLGQRNAATNSVKIKEQLARIEQQLIATGDAHRKINSRLEQLSTDVLQREIYRNDGDRHQLAIKDAKAGRGLNELVRRHGLSSDEAALIVSLHSASRHKTGSGPVNANLEKIASTDLE